MLKIGVIGLGNIAGKAYLPVLSSQPGVEVHLLSRNNGSLKTTGEKYRFEHLHHTLDSLIYSGIKAAFVHTATEAHFGIVKTLLEHEIHVFVDKPLTLDHSSSKELVELAESRKLILMVGFNRRYAPAYKRLKEIREPNMIIVQKNRHALPAELRTFIFDDFIHVVDTLRYLFPYPIDQILVNGMKKDELLYQVTLQFLSSNGATAFGIMNRDSGVTEERVEVFSTAEKGTVHNVSELFIQKGMNITRIGTDDWQPTLHKRGFEQMVSDFLQALQGGTVPQIFGRDALRTHEMCEIIIEKLG
ncbi:Gfo/Idh/MocA family oxidoreductase [Flavihumibacter sp. R14]|nr:Gfo/Idh/MocA family oxidoreductase [Flavihumibacter soli]